MTKIKNFFKAIGRYFKNLASKVVLLLKLSNKDNVIFAKGINEILKPRLLDVLIPLEEKGKLKFTNLLKQVDVIINDFVAYFEISEIKDIWLSVRAELETVKDLTCREIIDRICDEIIKKYNEKL